MPFKRIAKLLFRSSRDKPDCLRERFSVGRGTYGEPEVIEFGEAATLRVGAFCSIAGGVKIFLGGNHRIDWVTTYPFSVLRDTAKGIVGHPQSKGDVVIGNDVWVAANSTIFSGVTIGNGAVIGACAVVIKDVPPYTIVAGNPAKPIRKRFTDEQIAGLERIAWWSWTEEELDRAMALLLSPDVNALIAFGEKKSGTL